MNTLGWIFILVGGVIISTVSRGRVMHLNTDLSDAFLALIRGDAAALTEVFKRTGDDTTADAEVTVASTEGLGDAPAVHTYKLGKVKPHVKAAAEYFGSKYDIKTAYGIGAGSVPGSYHPKGRAIDWMVDGSTKDGKAKGDALAADLIATRDQWGIIEVIWYGRIWTPAKGWHDYHGPRNHKDHVHGSFTETHDIPSGVV